jgi:antitoxin component HigA of HigAB toxin-antitoxin module
LCEPSANKFQRFTMSHTHVYNICSCGSINMGRHVHVYNECECGATKVDNNVQHIVSQGASSLFGDKTEADTKGKALVSVAITEKQSDQQKQYDDDSQVVDDGLEVMVKSLDALSKDIKELGRCLKSSALASEILQRVQVRISKDIRGALDSEEKKIKVKDKRISALDRKLKKMTRNQQKIIFGYKCYLFLRYLVIALVIVIVVGSIIWRYSTLGQLLPSPSPSPSSSPSPSPSSMDNCTATIRLECIIGCSSLTGDDYKKCVDKCNTGC